MPFDDLSLYARLNEGHEAFDPCLGAGVHNDFFVAREVMDKADRCVFLLLEEPSDATKTRGHKNAVRSVGVGFFVGPTTAITPRHCLEGKAVALLIYLISEFLKTCLMCAGTDQLKEGAIVHATFSTPNHAFELSGKCLSSWAGFLAA